MEKILIIGAGGQIGVELTAALRRLYGENQVIATDIREEHPLLAGSGPFYHLNAMDAFGTFELVKREKVTQIYHLAAILSATGERDPKTAWDINMQSLLQILDISAQEKLHKVYWPSSIAVFGRTTPRQNTPQETVIAPETVYGISKYTGELWCRYYRQRWGIDVRSLRYPGLISWKTPPGGGTTDYAIDIFHAALKTQSYTSFLQEDSYLPMMYMEDAIRATIELMEAPIEKIKTPMAYNITAMSFSPRELAAEIKSHIPHFQIDYQPDFRQKIADGWPESIDDANARNDWGWNHHFNLENMVSEMLGQLKKIIPSSSVHPKGR